jgi:hypothetical protein
MAESSRICTQADGGIADAVLSVTFIRLQSHGTALRATRNGTAQAAGCALRQKNV